MPNRYANLVGNNRISEEYEKLNQGFDKVEQEMDAKAPIASPTFTGSPAAPTPPAGNNTTRLATTAFVAGAAGAVQTDLTNHKADDTRHMTTADRTKLAGIQAGAQVNAVTSVAGRTGAVAIGWDDVQSKPSSTPAAIDSAVTKVGGIETGAQKNQNAFAKVNDVTAAAPTDTVTITGGTGIAVTTNPTTKTVNITATGTSTPGAHASSHLSDGADPIPAATTSRGGLMSAVDKQALDQLKVKVDEGQTIPATINRGPNVINTSQASGATFKVLGCTRCNILGIYGGCENLGHTVPVGTGTSELSTTIYKSGNSSIKFNVNNSIYYRFRDFTYRLDPAKQYVLGAWVYLESRTAGDFKVVLCEYGTSTDRYSAIANQSILGSWQFVHVKVPKVNTFVNPGFRLFFGCGGANSTLVAYVDDIRLYEVSEADFTAIGTTITGDAIDAYLPYVDGVKHLQGVSVRETGKNLLPGMIDLLNSNAVINGEYDLSATTPAAFTIIAEVRIPIVAGQSYTLTVDRSSGGRVAGYWYSADGGHMGNSWVWTNASTYTAPNGAAKLRIVFDNNSAAGIFNFKNWMLVLGGVDQLPASFERRVDQYAHCPVPLASSIDRSVADSYDNATGQVFRRFKTVKLDGSADWNISTNSYTGFKRLNAKYLSSVADSTFCYAVKFNSAIIQNRLVPGGTLLNWGADIIVVGSQDTDIYIGVANSDSGWTDGLNPNKNAAKALTNGWRANSNNGSVYNSWVSILTGAAPPTNTEAYVANNKAPGWDAWATVDYVLATPVTEQLSGDLGGLSLDAGGNTVELLEGAVLREKANPVQGTGSNSRNEYYINLNQVTLPSYEVPSGSQLLRRAIAIAAIYDGLNRNFQWKVAASSNANGTVRASININDLPDPNNVFVDYIVLDKYAYTSNAIDAILTYQSTLGGAVAQATQDIATLKQHDGVLDFATMYAQALAENANRDIAAATSTATPGTLVKYDANGRIKSDPPVAANDVARKAETDAGLSAAQAASNAAQSADNKIGNLASLQTAAKSNVVVAVNELFTSVSSGKQLLADALTDRGVPSSAADTFSVTSKSIKDLLVSRPGVKWTRQTGPTPATGASSSGHFFYVAYGNGMYVALSDYNGDYATSPDGITWTNRNLGSTASQNNHRALRYVNSRFVALSWGGYIYNSTNGTSWANANVSAQSPNPQLNDVAYGNGIYVVVGGGGTILTSTNLSTWTQRSYAVLDPNINSVVFDGTKFIAVGNNITMTSTDGITWSRTNSVPSGSYRSLAYGNGVYVAVSPNDGLVATSTNGTTWTYQNIGTTGVGLHGLNFFNGLFVCGVLATSTLYKSIFVSKDGQKWYTITFTDVSRICDFCYNPTTNQFFGLDRYGTNCIVSTYGSE